MIRLAFLALALTPLTACADLTSPRSAAQSTVIDERIALGAELAFTAGIELGNSLARSGTIDKASYQKLSRDAYTALLAVRSAYKAANASDFAAAFTGLQTLLSGIKDLAK